MFRTPGSRAPRGRRSFGTVYSDQSNNLIGGKGAGRGVGDGTTDVVPAGEAGPRGNNILLGNNAGGSLVAGSRRNVFIGRNAGALNTMSDYGHNVCVGDDAGYNLVTPSASATFSACTGIGRAAGSGWTTDTYNVGIGHATFLFGGGSQGTVAIADTAGGAPVDGTGTNWQGTGLTYYGAVNDTNCLYIGRYVGKSSSAARTNSAAIGQLARIPAKDNVAVIGHGLVTVETAARYWDGWARVDITSSIGVTLPASSMIAGLLLHGGTSSAAVTDTTDTAANLVANGPGQNCEVPSSVEMSFANNTGGGFNVVVAGGAGVAISGLGLGGTVAAGVLAKFRIQITNSSSGAEAATLYRVG